MSEAIEMMEEVEFDVDELGDETVSIQLQEPSDEEEEKDENGNCAMKNLLDAFRLLQQFNPNMASSTSSPSSGDNADTPLDFSKFLNADSLAAFMPFLQGFAQPGNANASNPSFDAETLEKILSSMSASASAPSANTPPDTPPSSP